MTETSSPEIKVQITSVASSGAEIKWPAGWPIPPEDSQIDHPTAGTLWVRTVIWYPHGDVEDPEPFVYIVVGPRRVSY